MSAQNGSSSLGGVRSKESLFSQPDPTYSQVFYGTTNGQYSGYWHDGTRGTQVAGDVPPISAILAARNPIRKPVRPLVTTAKCLLANAIAVEKQMSKADKVLSADVIPKNFPVKAHNIEYPESSKRGSDNPLYATSGMAIGNEQPMEHQISDRYFPSTNGFTKTFVESKPRYTGLSTAPTYSKTHVALDEYY